MYYGAEISALSVNDNAVDLSVKPVRSIRPARFRFFRRMRRENVNRCTTSATGVKRDIQVYKNSTKNGRDFSTMPSAIKVSGSIAVRVRHSFRRIAARL